MDQDFEVRPFSSPAEYEGMIDYFVSAKISFLRGMGVDPDKLPTRENWLRQVLLDHEKDDASKDRLYLLWIYQGQPVGHSSLNQIKLGEEGYIHLHLWKAELRKRGLGIEFFKRSASYFMRRFRLQRVFCEPFAENPAPNRTLTKLGFKFVKRYRTVPGPINFEQEVNRYELDHELA